MTDNHPLQRFTAEITLANPDPALLELLTGMKIEDGEFVAKRPVLGPIRFHYRVPIKRTFWQWLRRKPRQYQSRYLFFPRVEFSESTED